MTSRWFIPTSAATALVLSFSVVCGHLLSLSQTRSTTNRVQDILSLYASFDRNVLADQAGGDETPLGNQNLKIVRDGRRGSAVYLDFGSLLDL